VELDRRIDAEGDDPMSGELVYRCDCGALVEFEPDDGDCEDDEVMCPRCEKYTPIAEATLRAGTHAAPPG
jgi:DNA-directed RNA polymerase subunit RPC12/RpoP